MSSRKRKPNWTEQECLLLAQLLQERKEAIRGKCGIEVSIQDKRQAWKQVAQSINNVFPQIHRTVYDCNKKWENLLAKSKVEIKRQKRQAGTGLSVDQLTTVTQVVVSVMDISDMLHHNTEDSPSSGLLEIKKNSDEDQKDQKIDERFSNNHPLREPELPTYSDESTSPAEHKITDFDNVSKSLAVHFSTHRADGFAASAEPVDTLYSSPPPAVNGTALQERMDLEMSVLRRQEAVLKLQEEYYTLKIKLMKKQTEHPLSKD